jgi:hypothetical protein
LGLNSAINDSFFLFDRVKQIIKFNLLFDEIIICLNFRVKLSFHHFVILSLIFINTIDHRWTVGLEIFIFLFDSDFLGSERVSLDFGHLLKTFTH